MKRRTHAGLPARLDNCLLRSTLRIVCLPWPSRRRLRTQAVPVDSKRVSSEAIVSGGFVTDAPNAAVKPPRARWLQLIFGILCMVMIANLQYGWTLFVGPIDQKFHWGSTAIQVAFTIFILTDTWLVPFEGYLIDRFGPRFVVLGGGVLVATAWVTNSFATSLPALYIGAGIGGAGAGAVYGTAVGNSLKWFTDRRGLAAGLTAAGFGAGTALTVPPIARIIETQGYQAAFLDFRNPPRPCGGGLWVFLEGAKARRGPAGANRPEVSNTPGLPLD